MEQRQTDNMRKMLMTALLSLSVGALASGPKAWPVPPAPQTGQYLMTSSMGNGQSLSAWCDVPNRVLALMPYAVVSNTTFSGGELYEWPKTAAGLGRIRASAFEWSGHDAGAGQVYQSFKLLDGPRKGQSGAVHTSNIENVQDPAYRMTKTGEFKLGNEVYKCRYVKDAAFIGVTAKRTVIIWDNGKTATYATRNFDGSAGIYVTGGKISRPVNGKTHSEFASSGGYAYRVSNSVRSSPAGLALHVFRDNKAISEEPFLAYSVSIPKK